MSKTDVTISLEYCLQVLREEGVIAYPTEAVFGLGCDPDSEQAVLRLLAFKQRPVEKGLILIAADYTQLLPYIDETSLSGQQKSSVFSSWPGPITWIFPASKKAPRWVTGSHDSLAVRVSDHPIVQHLCRAFGKPLISTSANLSGKTPCKTWEEVLEQFGINFPVVKGATGERQNPSEIRDVLTGAVIRQG